MHGFLTLVKTYLSELYCNIFKHITHQKKQLNRNKVSTLRIMTTNLPSETISMTTSLEVIQNANSKLEWHSSLMNASSRFSSLYPQTMVKFLQKWDKIFFRRQKFPDLFQKYRKDAAIISGPS